MSIVQLGVLFALLSLFISEKGLFDAFQVETVSAHAGLVFFSLLYSPISFFLGIAQNAWSRRNEFEADAFAAQTLGTPASLIEGLKTLSVANLGNLTPHKLTVFLTEKQNNTHCVASACNVIEAKLFLIIILYNTNCSRAQSQVAASIWHIR